MHSLKCLKFEGVRFCLKNSRKYLSLFSLLFACFLVFGFILRPLVTYAAVSDLMIGSSSNALMTLELNDDYGIMPYSSLSNISNTVDFTGALVRMAFKYKSNDTVAYNRNYTIDSNGKFYGYALDDSVYLSDVHFYLYKKNLPVSGVYSMAIDFSSDFSLNYSGNFCVYSLKSLDNASSISESFVLPYQQSSGDFYVYPVDVQVTNVDYIESYLYVDKDSNIQNFGGTIKFKFTKTDNDPDYSFAGGAISNQDYQNDVSSSLSDLSSSVGEMSDEISGVTEAIQNLQGAMEPHYNNVLTQLHHITEQLHAFWDQQFNLHHVPLMAKLEDIKSAIANMDLEVVVELDELKQTVNNMSQAIQNKLQSVQDTLTGGYNTGGIDSDQGKLEDSFTEYEEAEKNVIDKVNDSLNDFEFDSGFEEYSNTISTISDFLQALYDSSGGFKVVINLSLMLSLASLVIGFYRFKG